MGIGRLLRQGRAHVPDGLPQWWEMLSSNGAKRDACRSVRLQARIRRKPLSDR